MRRYFHCEHRLKWSQWHSKLRTCPPIAEICIVSHLAIPILIESLTNGSSRTFLAQFTCPNLVRKTSATGETRLTGGKIGSLHVGQVWPPGAVFAGKDCCFAFKHFQWNTSEIKKALALNEVMSSLSLCSSLTVADEPHTIFVVERFPAQRTGRIKVTILQPLDVRLNRTLERNRNQYAIFLYSPWHQCCGRSIFTLVWFTTMQFSQTFTRCSKQNCVVTCRLGHLHRPILKRCTKSRYPQIAGLRYQCEITKK